MAEVRIWCKDTLTDVYQVRNSDLNLVHFENFANTNLGPGEVNYRKYRFRYFDCGILLTDSIRLLVTV